MRAHFFRSFFCNFTRLLYELITAFALLQTSLNDYFISFPHGHLRSVKELLMLFTVLETWFIMP